MNKKNIYEKTLVYIKSEYPNILMSGWDLMWTYFIIDIIKLDKHNKYIY